MERADEFSPDTWIDFMDRMDAPYTGVKGSAGKFGQWSTVKKYYRSIGHSSARRYFRDLANGAIRPKYRPTTAWDID